MGTTTPRILVGRIYQETNSFNPVRTTSHDFTVEHGLSLAEVERAGTAILGGIIRRLEQGGAAIVPSLSAMARPGGPVEHALYESLKREVVAVATANRVEAVALELHGAMVTDQLDDPEGDLLADLRAALGPAAVIGVGLDLHAYVTPKMLSAVSFCIACKTNPHNDFPETGEKVASLVLDTLDGRIRPVIAYAPVPMLLPGALETADGPLACLHARAREWQRANPSLLDISICNAMTFIDAPGSGQGVIVTANGDAQTATAAAADLASSLWEMRDRFSSRLPTIDDALDVVLAQPERRPFVLGDQGDRVLAGAPGDSNAILRRLLERDVRLRAAVPITDPIAVAAAKAAGVGATISLGVGGRQTPGGTPLPLTGRVAHGSDGRFVLSGPFMAGQQSSLGDSVVLVSGPISVLLTTRAGLTQDPAAFTSQGIDIARQDLIVSKSGHHFKVSFDGLATPLVVGSPGLSLYRRGAFPFRRKRPIWPEDDIEFPGPAVHVFRPHEADRPRDARTAHTVPDRPAPMH